MKFRFTLITLFLGLSAFSAFAQNHYTAGKVYTASDTLTGYINSQYTARYVKFKAENAKIAEYTPHQILGFEKDGLVYLSKKAVTSPYGEKIKEPLFMEQLARGKISLYYYKERNNEEHYWVEKEGEMIELQGGRKVVTVNQVKYQKEDKTYQVFLQQLFSDCNEPDLHKCAYNKRSLTEAVYNYNRCKGEAAARNQYKKEKITLYPGLKIGGNFFSEASSSYLLSPSVGLFINIPFRGASRILSGQIEAVYNQYATTQIPASRHYSFIDFGALIRATYPKGYIRPFGAVGFAYGLGLEEVRSVADTKYISGKDGRPKLALEAGLQVPLGKRFIYTGARYEKFVGTPKGYYKLFNFSLGVGF